MFSLAAFRYRNVLSVDGGPLDSIESQVVPVLGRGMFQTNARLLKGLVNKVSHALYGDADGTGTHRIASVARHMAISQALERWAFHSSVCSDRAGEYGFDLDPSSNGISAFPGLVGSKARRNAILEAVERFSLTAWWEGRCEGRVFDTDWPGVSAVAIDGPFGGVTVIAFARTDFGMHAYGYAAEESFGAACERAIVKLARHECVMRGWWLSYVVGEKRTPSNVFERRSLFFATDAGHDVFQQRLKTQVRATFPVASVICDREIDGPWSDYTTVWRYALRPISEGYLDGGDDYFCW